MVPVDTSPSQSHPSSSSHPATGLGRVSKKRALKEEIEHIRAKCCGSSPPRRAGEDIDCLNLNQFQSIELLRVSKSSTSSYLSPIDLQQFKPL